MYVVQGLRPGAGGLKFAACEVVVCYRLIHDR